jgi:transcription-repair coupling factor (superfamily II helicase)
MSDDAAPAAFLQDTPRLVLKARALQGVPLSAAPAVLTELIAGTGADRRKSGVKLPLLVVVPTRAEADRLTAALAWLLGARRPGVSVLPYPADDVRTWDGLSPHPDLPRQRLVALDALTSGRQAVLVAPARALQQRVLPPETLADLRIELETGAEVGKAALVGQLVDRGYLSTPQADEPGTVSSKGGVVDLWPTGEARPVRIEFFDDEIDGMRALDPRTRRGAEPVETLTVLPAREAVVTPDALSRASEVTVRAVGQMGGGQQTRRAVLRELKEGLWFPGAEDYLAALHPVVDPLRFADDILLLEPDRIDEELLRFEALVTDRWLALPVDDRPVILPEARFATAAAVQARLTRAVRMGSLLLDGDAPDLHFRDNDDLRVGTGELAPVAGRIAGWLEEGWRVAVVCESRASAERVQALLLPHGLALGSRPAGQLPGAGQIGLWIGPLEQGFRAADSRLAVIAAHELFGKKPRKARRGPRSLREASVATLTQLKVGDLVVHVVHGVGRFEGLKRIAMPTATGDTVEQDFAELSYRSGDRMYLPATRLDQLHKFRAAGDKTPSLDRLGGGTWASRKAKVRDKIAAMAHQLLELHAMRAIVQGHRYEGVPARYRQFEETFAYVETPDQAQAIRDVLDDMAGEEPMDRLVVGDVGFGKTEVAMRAAMRVVLAGRQVAILCPTTVLAYQHWRTFEERFEGFGVSVALLSRFRDPKEARALRKRCADGDVDILIGTHALLGRSAKFKDLGLLVIDEEHRFGVKQKEKLKALAQKWSDTPCEVLAMSATPIPRTLHMALSGLRKVSMIATPPEGRRAIQTRILRWTDARIREEILHELKRGGQVFFVHNRVQSIQAVARRLAALVPEARFGTAHGQMDEHVLEDVLVRFVNRDFHVLVCTTIIETGIDMPNVNTILVNRADQMGLAQLYQLRGRVGRSNVRGYCSLLVPEDTAALNKKAVKRLRVLAENTDLGSGFAIASADMEIRGAGDLLGESQHGNIQAIGFDTYVEMLEDAVAAARGDLSRKRLDPEIEVPVPALIPDAWIDDVAERITEYRRLAGARTVAQARDIIATWEDTHGEPPPEVLNLGWLTETRIRCRELGIERLSWLKVRVELELHESTPVPAAHVVALVTREPDRFSFAKGSQGGRIRVRFTDEEAQYPFRFLHWVLRRFEQGVEDGPGAGITAEPVKPRPVPPKPTRRPVFESVEPTIEVVRTTGNRRIGRRRVVRPKGSGFKGR